MINNVSFKAFDASAVNSQIEEVKKRSSFNSNQQMQTEKSNNAGLGSNIFNVIPNFLKLKASVIGWGTGIFNATWSSLLAGAAILGVASTTRQYYTGNGFMKGTFQALKSIPKAAWNKIKNVHEQKGLIKTAGKTISKPFVSFWKTTVGDAAKGLFVALPKATFNYVKNSKAGNIGKTIAVLSGVSLYAYNIFHAFIKVNEKHAEIDHQFRVGHNN